MAICGDELRRGFASQGAVCVRGVLGRQWLDRLSGIFEELRLQGDDLSGYYGDESSQQPGAGRGQTIIRDDCWRLSALFLSFLRESPLVSTAASLLGSQRVNLYEDLLIYKSAGAEQPTPWHQDEPQWPLSGRQMASGWFCLDPVTQHTGALRFAVGTHNGPLYQPAVPPAREADLAADSRHFDGGELPDVEADPGRFVVRVFDVDPGDVVFFHPRVLHAALGSAPMHARRTFSVRFLGDDVRWLPKRSVFHEWLKHVPLSEGDRVSGERFPILWSRAANAANEPAS